MDKTILIFFSYYRRKNENLLFKFFDIFFFQKNVIFTRIFFHKKRLKYIVLYIEYFLLYKISYIVYITKKNKKNIYIIF